MNTARMFRHLITPGWLAHRAFRPADVAAVTAAVAASEDSHRGELCIVAEGPLPIGRLLTDQSPRARALDLFGRLGVWDTRENCGVLVYIQLVDRRVEILADRGIAAKLGSPDWEAICREMEAAFKAGAYRRGVLDAVERVTRLLSLHFPARARKANELPDRPVLL
jgi:uncharacterized membrane protein